MKNQFLLRRVAPLLACAMLAGTVALPAWAVEVTVTLTGANEVPPVQTAAKAIAKMTIGDDGSVTGTIKTSGIEATMAHIHRAAAGANGPVIVKLLKDGDGFKTPPGAMLDADQLKAFKAGELYVNVHSAEHKSGEIRAQLK